ncbi:MAG: OmpA family protein [Nitrospinota bacterium]
MARRPLALLALSLLLAGCVAMDDYDRKMAEASDLRRQLEGAQGRVGSQAATIETLRNELGQKRAENEELTQSLSMARRHSQQTESRVSDLRAQVSGQKQESETTTEKLSNIQKEFEDNLQKSRQLEKDLNETRTRLARFEDRLRLQAQLEKDIEAQLAAEVKSKTIEVKREGDRVMLTVSSAVLFAPGSVNVKDQGNKVLAKVAQLLRRYANREVQVHGHTDNLRITERLAERWETNWELATARATRVLRYLVEVGNLDPRRSSAAGFGEFRPIADNATPEGRERNRRIEIIVFPPDAS